MKIYDRGRISVNRNVYYIRCIKKVGFLGIGKAILYLGHIMVHDINIISKRIFEFLMMQLVLIKVLGFRNKIKSVRFAFQSAFNVKQWQFDTDSIDMVMDNSANVHICNQRSFLYNFKTLEFDCGIDTVSEKAVPEGIGEMDIT